MARKPTPKPDDPEQSERFVEQARELETDESGKAFDRAIGKITQAGKTINRTPESD